MSHLPPQGPNYSLPKYPPPALELDPVYLDGHCVYPPGLPQHACCPHIHASRKCGGRCSDYYAGTGPFKCSNLHCLGHPSLWSSACYTQSRLQPRQRLSLSVYNDLKATHPSRLERYMANPAGAFRPTENPEDDNWGPLVFRRAPQPSVVDYDNNRDNLFVATHEDSHAGSMMDVRRHRPRMQETFAKAVPNRHEAMLTHADEAERMAESIVTLVLRKRVSRCSDKDDRKTQEEKASVAHMAARFAKEERYYTNQEDFYQFRDPSEDPLPPLATSMEDLMEGDVHIEAQRHRANVHEYRNSLLTSTTNPNIDKPSKPSLDNPIIDIAIDQFLTQEPEKRETLHQKLGKLCGIAMERADKLGLQGVTEEDSYLLKHIRASKRKLASSFWADDYDDDGPAASFRDKQPKSKAEGKRPVEDSADAASARCQHRSCQPNQSRSRRSSTFSNRTSYGPFSKESEIPAEDLVKSEEQFPGRTLDFREESLAKCVYNWEAPLRPSLEPVARAVCKFDSEHCQPLSDGGDDQAYVDEFRKIGEYDHWKLEKVIDEILQDTVAYHALQRHLIQDLRARIFDPRNPKARSLEQLQEQVAHLEDRLRLTKEYVQLEKDKLAAAKSAQNEEPSDRPFEKDEQKSLEQLPKTIAQAAEKAEKTIKHLHGDLDKRSAPRARTNSKQTKHAARYSLRAKKCMFRKKAHQPIVSDAAGTYENLQSERGKTSDSSSSPSDFSKFTKFSDYSDIVKSFKRFDDLTEDRRREWFRSHQEDVAKIAKADLRTVQKRNAEVRARNNVKYAKEIKRLISPKRSKQATVEDSADIGNNPLLSTRTNSSLSLKTNGALKAPLSVVDTSAVDSPTSDNPWMVPIDYYDSEVEAVIFSGRSPRSSVHPEGGDDFVKSEGDDITSGGAKKDIPDMEKASAEMEVEEDEALRLEEEEIIERMDENLRTMIKGDRKKGIKDV